MPLAGQVQEAIGMATAAMTSYVLANALHLAGSYWSVLSAVIVFRFDFGNALGASRDRLLGTVAGAVLTVSFLSLARLWSIPGLLLLAAIVIPLSLLAALRPQYRTALVTSIIVLSAGGPVTTPLAVAVGRVLAVGLGAFIGGLFSFILSFAKQQTTGYEPAAKIILDLGFLFPLSRRPGDTEQAGQLQRDIYSELQRLSFVARLRNPEVAPIVRILTRIYWDIIFIGRVAPTAPGFEDSLRYQTTLPQVAMSFQHVCVQTVENMRHAQPLPTLIEFDEMCSHLGNSGTENPLPPERGENTIVSLLQLLRQDVDALIQAIAESPCRSGFKPRPIIPLASREGG